MHFYWKCVLKFWMAALQTSCFWVFLCLPCLPGRDSVPRQTPPTLAMAGGRGAHTPRVIHSGTSCGSIWSQGPSRQCLPDLWRKSNFCLLCPVKSPQLGGSGSPGILCFQLKYWRACSVPMGHSRLCIMSTSNPHIRSQRVHQFPTLLVGQTEVIHLVGSRDGNCANLKYNWPHYLEIFNNFSCTDDFVLVLIILFIPWMKEDSINLNSRNWLHAGYLILNRWDYQQYVSQIYIHLEGRGHHMPCTEVAPGKSETKDCGK